MVKARADYIGDKRTKITHLDSGSEITTSAPKDNQGDGMLFSPTDLVGAALSSCILTILGIVSEKRSIDISGASCEVEKEMQTSPRRIKSLRCVVHLPANIEAADREVLERAGRGCPVHGSLHPEIEAPIDFVYDLKNPI